MPGSSSRRQWLKNSATAIAGMSLLPTLFATEKERYRAAGIILLNGNENAYGPSEAARKAMSEGIPGSNRYPDDIISSLRKQIADFWQVRKENILLGAGSSEIIGLTLQLAGGKGYIKTAEPSYKIWHNQAAALGYDFVQVPLNNEKKYDLKKISSYEKNFPGRVLYICNPNNPTGTYIEPKEIEEFLNSARDVGYVLIDEAYTEYANIPSLAQYAIKSPNIIVAKTFSKIYGLAGARVGYAIAYAETINKLAAFQPWPNANVSLVAAAGASAALNDQQFVKDCREKAGEARQICYKCFDDLKLNYIKSNTNFILFNVDKIGTDFSKKMQAQSIYVQYRDHFGGKWCRVSMGTIEEMQSFCSALKSIAG